MDASAIKAADAKVRETVESILGQIEERGDDAVRELAQAQRTRNGLLVVVLLLLAAAVALLVLRPL